MNFKTNNNIKLLLEKNPVNKVKSKSNAYLTLNEAINELKTRPKHIFLWNGIPNDWSVVRGDLNEFSFSLSAQSIVTSSHYSLHAI